jgi:hypothetical protein
MDGLLECIQLPAQNGVGLMMCLVERLFVVKVCHQSEECEEHSGQ